MVSTRTHTVIFVPGLGSDVSKARLATNFWHGKGFNPVVFDMQWRDGEHFEPKFRRLLGLVDEQLDKGKVSLVGMSAGGSAVGNAFLERRNKVNAMVNVCGRLRGGTVTGFRSFANMTKTSVAFAESVVRFEEGEPSLTESDRQRVLTLRSLADELVPGETSTITGATNLRISSIEHMLSISLAVTLYSHTIKGFLRKAEV